MLKKPLTFSRDQNPPTIGSVDINQLIQTYGTPLYVLDKQSIVHNANQFLHPLSEHCPSAKVLYAGKANLTIGIAQLITELGLCLDVSSGGELYTAIKANVPEENIYFHGNNKTTEELTLAIEYGVTIMLDNPEELKKIHAVNKDKKIIPLFLRLKPEIDAHTHEYIRTGQLDSKFGMEKKDCLAIINSIKQEPTIQLKGIHAHIGSQIFDEKPYLELIDTLLPFIQQVKAEHGITIEELNVGGGMGVYYSKEDQPLNIEPFIKTFVQTLKNACKQAEIKEPKLLFEPGRSIIASAGITLYTIGAIKDIEGIKTYLFVDGGMADNPRPIMYQAEYSFEKLTQSQSETKQYSIAGKYCESGDILGENISLEHCEPGDHLIVFGTGAYNYSMASNYNRNTRPAMVMVDDGTVVELVKRETYDDLIRLDQTL